MPSLCLWVWSTPEWRGGCDCVGMATWLLVMLSPVAGDPGIPVDPWNVPEATERTRVCMWGLECGRMVACVAAWAYL